MYARLTLVGRLGRDAELRATPSAQVIRFSIPITQRLPSGEERTQWVECSYWRSPGESTEVIKYLKKGTTVLVEGSPSVRLYTRQDNTPGVSLDCRVSTLRILVYPSAQEEAVSPQPVEAEPLPEEPVPPELPPENEGDLPF